jgi:hypothetical protein
MVHDPKVSDHDVFMELCCSIYGGDEWGEPQEDVYLYDDDHSNCFFYHRGVKFNIASLSNVRPRKSSGETTTFDICVVLCDHQDPKYSTDGILWWHFLPEAWVYDSGSDLDEGSEVCSLFIEECDKYIDAWGEEKLIKLQKQEE